MTCRCKWIDSERTYRPFRAKIGTRLCLILSWISIRRLIRKMAPQKQVAGSTLRSNTWTKTYRTLKPNRANSWLPFIQRMQLLTEPKWILHKRTGLRRWERLRAASLSQISLKSQTDPKTGPDYQIKGRSTCIQRRSPRPAENSAKRSPKLQAILAMQDIIMLIFQFRMTCSRCHLEASQSVKSSATFRVPNWATRKNQHIRPEPRTMEHWL